MKFCFLLIFLFTLFACKNSKNDNAQEKIDYYQFQKINLDKYELPISMYLPDASAGIGTSFKPQITHDNGDYKWQISVGRYFNLFFEDYGDFKYLFEEKKKAIENNKVYKTKIVKNEPSILVYEQRLKESISYEEKASFHIYAVVKIKGVYYQIMNDKAGNSEKEIGFMYQSIKSIKEK
jgi:hypothetical protein